MIALVVYATKGQDIPTQTGTNGALPVDYRLVNFDAVDLDSHGMYDPAAKTITTPDLGELWWEVYGKVTTGSVKAGSSLYAWVMGIKEGLDQTVAADVKHGLAAIHNAVCPAKRLVKLAPKMPVEVRLLQASGQPMPLVGGREATYLVMVCDPDRQPAAPKPDVPDTFPDPVLR